MSSQYFSRKLFICATLLGLVFSGVGMLGICSAADDAKQGQPAKEGAKEGDAKVAEEETAEAAFARISQALMRTRKFDEYETEKAKFLEKFSTSPIRWNFKLLDAQVALRSIKSRDELEGALKNARGILAEVLTAQDAPATLKENASLMNVQCGMSGGSPDEILKLVSDHIRAYPDSMSNAGLANNVVASVSRGDPEKALVALEKLAGSDVKLIASLAAKKIDSVKALLELKKNPMDLKFTAVDGKEFDLTGMRGKVVLIDFWATWCGPCVAGLPEVIELYGKHHEKGLEIVGISFDQDKEKLTEFVEKKEMPWPQYFDGKGWGNQYGTKYGINGIPTMWLVGKDGKVVDFEARQDLGKKIEKLLSE